MTVIELVNELKVYGYDLYLDSENIRYKFHALVKPPEERSKVLLDLLKRNKPGVIEYLKATDTPNKSLTSHEAVPIQQMSLREFEKAGLTLKVRSEILNELVVFTSGETDTNRFNTLGSVAYTAKELQAMLTMMPDEVRAAHEVKKAFNMAKIIKHRNDRSCQK